MEMFHVKKGAISFENLLLFSFFFVFLIFIIYSGIFTYNHFCKDSSQKNIISAYNNIVTIMKSDCNFANTSKVSTSSLILLDNKSLQISKYELKNNTIFRYDKDNKEYMLFDGIESINFSSTADLPNLITIRIYPLDKNEIPFFTSFALRGYYNDK